jgi:hypothetical protein
MTLLRTSDTRNNDIVIVRETNMTLPLDTLGKLSLPAWSGTVALPSQITSVKNAFRI